MKALNIEDSRLRKIFCKVSLKNDNSMLVYIPSERYKLFVNIADDVIYYNYCVNDISLPLIQIKIWNFIYILNEEKLMR